MNPLRQQPKGATRSMNRGDSFSSFNPKAPPGPGGHPDSYDHTEDAHAHPEHTGLVDKGYKYEGTYDTPRGAEHMYGHPAGHAATTIHGKPGVSIKEGIRKGTKLAASVQGAASTDPALSRRKEMESYFTGAETPAGAHPDHHAELHRRAFTYSHHDPKRGHVYVNGHGMTATHTNEGGAPKTVIEGYDDRVKYGPHRREELEISAKHADKSKSGAKFGFRTMGDHARDALAERGYAQSGNPATGATEHLHPDGHSVTVYGGSAIIRPHKSRSSIRVTSHQALRHELGQLHGEGAKHSARGAKFNQQPKRAWVKKDHHDVLGKHGYVATTPTGDSKRDGVTRYQKYGEKGYDPNAVAWHDHKTGHTELMHPDHPHDSSKATKIHSAYDLDQHLTKKAKGH